ncbi:hypothetical protein [Desulfosarcina cetonica]|uniref:hypothetical protein n=1 Tax=Desulfosarcina cetonica TaxID=90730 RepID=UPI0006CF5313|nr:hypothetical protein [Desulfosarcina cetonica]
MKPITLLATFSIDEFHDLCTAIVKSHIAAHDLANPMHYTCSLSPAINVTEDCVKWRVIEGYTFTYNIMSHDATPSGNVACMVNHVFLFQTHYFEVQPTTQQGCLSLLEETLLGSLDIVFRHISRTDNRSDYQTLITFFSQIWGS